MNALRQLLGWLDAQWHAHVCPVVARIERPTTTEPGDPTGELDYDTIIRKTP